MRGLVLSLLTALGLMLALPVAPASGGAPTETVMAFTNQISRVDLSPDLRSGVVEAVITSDHFQVPTTAAPFGHRLAAMNSKFDTGVPPTATQFEAIIVQRLTTNPGGSTEEKSHADRHRPVSQGLHP